MEELLRAGRQVLSALYCAYYSFLDFAYGGADYLPMRHTHSPVGPSSSPQYARISCIFTRPHSSAPSSPPELAAWFEEVFGPLILCAERTIKAQLREQDADSDAQQPAKRPRTDDAKYSESFDFFLRLRPTRPSKSTGTLPRLRLAGPRLREAPPRFILQDIKNRVGTAVTEPPLSRVREVVAAIQKQNVCAIGLLFRTRRESCPSRDTWRIAYLSIGSPTSRPLASP
ncbi:hypothetical protein MSAN_00345400 [Mycena sanguinolenta]|uniref:Uncharacterized protein n=1 Tax=Mycena sanguinolenta TaxID=230812 RepID=A0A8H7DJH9_9AGAR|nr:hypothetical protein MSAN_00345400 [Mycena sanguinolenta]